MKSPPSNEGEAVRELIDQSGPQQRDQSLFSLLLDIERQLRSESRNDFRAQLGKQRVSGARAQARWRSISRSRYIE